MLSFALRKVSFRAAKGKLPAGKRQGVEKSAPAGTVTGGNLVYLQL